MKGIRAKIKSMSPLLFDRYITLEKEKNVTGEEWERKIYKEKSYFDKDGRIYIPGLFFKKSILGAAKLLNETMKGEGKKKVVTYFKQGGFMIEPAKIYTGNTIDDLIPYEVYTVNPSTGGRVFKVLPMLESWKVEFSVVLLSGKLTPEMAVKYIKAAGLYIGIGTFRAEKGNDFGRYFLEDWEIVEGWDNFDLK